MRSGRFLSPIIFILALGIFSPTHASALWGFGETEGKSGLNLDQGYDLNTVTTVRGRVVSVDSADPGGPVTIIMRQGSETVHVITAPAWFWSDRGIAVKPQDDIVVQGAKAQGKDGAMYVISRKISNLTTGDSVSLRSETGRPIWKGGAGSDRSVKGVQRRNGSGARGR
jgi:hypothetical protein